MKLFFSARYFMPRASGGIVGYFEGLVDAIVRRHPEHEVHVGFHAGNIREIGPRLPEAVHRHLLHGLDPTNWARNEARLLVELGIDCAIHCVADPSNTYSEDGSFKVATCIADLQHLHHRYFFRSTDRALRDEAFGVAIGKSDTIFTLSEFVRDDVLSTYACDEEKVTVVYPSATTAFLNGPASVEARRGAGERHSLPESYAIFPGNFWPHKNHLRLIEALLLLEGRGVRIPFVFVGDQTAMSPELEDAMSRLREKGLASILGYVSDADLHALISGARCLVFPSLFEGFGIPVAEALAVGVPVASSNVCSLPEVGGDVAEYFDPYDPEAIASCVEKVWATSADRSEEFTRRARAQAERFNYESSAAVLLGSIQGKTAPKPESGYQLTVLHEPPLVSVVTPSFQHAEFLKRCIESVLSQDYPRIEYTVCDGGSTDGTKEILESYGDRFQWKSEPDGGQTNAINDGLRRATGQVLTYLNSDDVLLPGAVSAIVESWRKVPSADVVYGRANYIDEHDRTISEYATQPFNVETFKGLCYICQPAAFWGRKIMDHAGLFDTEFQYAMDYEFWQRIAARGGVFHYHDGFIACSRDYSSTKTRSQRAKIFRDIFRSQWRHWDRVHPDWWIGYLSYLKDESDSGWSTFVPADMGRRVRISHMLSFAARDWRKEFHVSLNTFKKQRENRIDGIHSDGWVQPRATIERSLARDREIYVEGLCPWQNRIEVATGTGRQVFDVAAGETFRYTETVKSGRLRLHIVASTPASDNGDNRSRAFLLQATNLLG